ncbi:MAG: type II toxin-antitoxin system HicA family toxin [Citrobacter amalonaticus]|nr:type II toxin-antitoxin system HicA family toxin [Citrobacter amalonaticus]
MFGKRITPITYKEVVTALRSLGFEMVPKKATAHEKWVLEANGRRRVVIVDKHIAPFDKRLIKLMAQEAGMSTKDFHQLCKNPGDFQPDFVED